MNKHSTGLPILADVPPGDNADIIREYGEGSYLVTSGEKGKLVDVLRKAFELRLETKPRLNENFVKTFNRAALAQKLAERLDKI